MNKKTLNTLLVGAVAATALGASAAHAGVSEDQEKCYGVVKGGMNGCGAADGSHGCAGQATVDGSSVEWVSVPTGLCEKLAGGSLEPAKAEEENKEKEM